MLRRMLQIEWRTPASGHMLHRPGGAPCTTAAACGQRIWRWVYSICMLRIGLDVASGFDVGAAEDQSPIVGSHTPPLAGLVACLPRRPTQLFLVESDQKHVLSLFHSNWGGCTPPSRFSSPRLSRARSDQLTAPASTRGADPLKACSCDL